MGSKVQLIDNMLHYGSKSKRMMQFEADLLEEIMAHGSLSRQQTCYTERSFHQLMHNIRGKICELTLSDNILINVSDDTYRFINIQETIDFGRLSLDFSWRYASLDSIIPLTHSESLMLWEMMKAPGKSFCPSDLTRCIYDSPGSDRQGQRDIGQLIAKLRRKIESDPVNPVYLRGDEDCGYRIGPHSESYYAARLCSFSDPAKFIGYNPSTDEIRYPPKSGCAEEPMEERIKGKPADILRFLYKARRASASDIKKHIWPESDYTNIGTLIRRLRVILEPGLGTECSDYVGCIRGNSGDGYFLA